GLLDNSAGAADNPYSGLQLQGSDDSGARRSASADRHPDADESDRPTADSLSTHSVRSADRTSGTGAKELERAGAGRLHLRHPESARTIQVRGRVRLDITSESG